MDYLPLTVLVDLDGVVYDWDARYEQLFRQLYPDLECPRMAGRPNYSFVEGMTAEQDAASTAVMNHPGFYLDMPLIPGAVESLNAMLAAGIDVVLCSTPSVTNPTCASDKITSVGKDLGVDWPARTILTADKTRAIGDVLLDDKSAVTGRETPTWEHVYFTQSYNAGRTDHRRLDAWAAWADVLLGAPELVLA